MKQKEQHSELGERKKYPITQSTSKHFVILKSPSLFQLSRRRKSFSCSKHTNKKAESLEKGIERRCSCVVSRIDSSLLDSPLFGRSPVRENMMVFRNRKEPPGDVRRRSRSSISFHSLDEDFFREFKSSRKSRERD